MLYQAILVSSIYNLNKLDCKFISSKKIKSKQVSENITLLLCFLFEPREKKSERERKPTGKVRDQIKRYFTGW